MDLSLQIIAALTCPSLFVSLYTQGGRGCGRKRVGPDAAQTGIPGLVLGPDTSVL